ncbi:MAG: hypothetical protein ACXVB1_05175 [Pseudobdellovibrionaceae bacterium]
MNKFSILFLASVLAVSGIFALFIRPMPTSSHLVKQEVPSRSSRREVASTQEVSTSQPAALSVRKSAYSQQH